MDTSTVTYLGGLRTEAVHVRSGVKINTDAPLDNHGRGEAFSPTDLMSTSLACCMMTLMGIAAENKRITLKGLKAAVVKKMAVAPRKVESIEIRFEMEGSALDDRQRAILEHAARTCPVSLSLNSELQQKISFTYL
ncbi:MAG: OsmC family protein [Flavobacteriales bacterium]